MRRYRFQPVQALAITTILSATIAAAVRAQQDNRIRVLLPAYRQAVTLDTIMFVTDQEGPATKVWAAAARVFYDYKIPTDLRDSIAGTVGTTKFVKSTYMVNFPMSKVLNCGSSITGPNADNFRISLALVARVSQVGPDRTKLGVGFVGSGLDMRGNSTDPVVCASTGQLESDFAARVKKILAMAP